MPLLCDSFSHGQPREIAQLDQLGFFRVLNGQLLSHLVEDQHVVGESETGYLPGGAFRWTEETGMVDLG